MCSKTSHATSAYVNQWLLEQLNKIPYGLTVEPNNRDQWHVFYAGAGYSMVLADHLKAVRR